MNRRKFLKWLLVAPLAGVAGKAAVGESEPVIYGPPGRFVHNDPNFGSVKVAAMDDMADWWSRKYDKALMRSFKLGCEL